MLISLYLHFPFCKRKCSYCDFCSSPGDADEIAAYCHALEAEIKLAARAYPEAVADTVFLGGGTPSVVPAPFMRGVLKTLRERFTILPEAEFTSEANPGTLTDAWLDELREAGGNRLSIGAQAAQASLLRILGRIHGFPEAVEALETARRHGFTNLNADVMFGLPTQTANEYLDTLRALAQTGVTHLSAYSLILEEGTPLWGQVARGEQTLPDEDATAEMMEAGVRLLSTLGYRRYEISNFALPGCECRHNLGYWRQKHYLGLGLSAASRLPPGEYAPGAQYIRRTNTASMAEYLRRIGEGCLPVADTEPISPAEARFETVMLGLRTVEGVRYADFERMHGVALPTVYGGAINELKREGLLQAAGPDDPRLALTERGLMLQNTALMAFMSEDERRPHDS